MIKVLIVEDEEIAVRQLERLLRKCDPNIVIAGICYTIKQTITALNSNSDIDLIFLDIHLADGMVFDLFKSVSLQAEIIFVTAYDDHAVKAFELNSLDYLLKPVRLERLAESIERFKKAKANERLPLERTFQEILTIISKNESKYKSRFLVKGGSKLIPVSSKEIAYFIRDVEILKMTLKTGKTYIIKYTIEELEKILDPKEFFKLNRQVITSVDSLSQIHTFFKGKLKVELIPPVALEIFVSQERSTAFKKWLDGEASQGIDK